MCPFRAMIFGDNDNICCFIYLLRGSHGNWILVDGLQNALEKAETSETLFYAFKNFRVARD
jgi:hypothetical protein